jgi:ATP phosphoribosyltransferase regulatory subunit
VNGLELLLPPGTKDFLSDRAERLAEIQATAFKVFTRWGFRPVIMPGFEHLEVFSLGSGPDLEAAAFKLNDRATGKVIAITPDFTPQVARLVASRMRELPRPLRLFYGGRVLRDGPWGSGRSRELFQAGVELIGLESAEADSEMIAMAVESISELGINDFRISVGQLGFIRAMLNSAELSPEIEPHVRAALAKKDVSGLNSLVKGGGLSSEKAEMIGALPGLYGGQEMLARAAKLCRDEAARAALENLNQVLATVQIYGLSDYICIDLGEMRGFDYHTGVIFEGFVSGQGYEVLQGGRYDSLLGKYGLDCPATGFTLNLEALLLARESRGLTGKTGGLDFLIISLESDKRPALEIAKALRSMNFRVARDIIKRDIEGSLNYAERNGIARALILGHPGCQPGEAILKDVPGGEEVVVKTFDIIGGRFPGSVPRADSR